MKSINNIEFLSSVNGFFFLSARPVNKGPPCFSTGLVLWRLVYLNIFLLDIVVPLYILLIFYFYFTCCLSCHQNLLGRHPPNHVVSALEYLASREQKGLEEKIVSLDVTQDVTALR